MAWDVCYIDNTKSKKEEQKNSAKVVVTYCSNKKQKAECSHCNSTRFRFFNKSEKQTEWEVVPKKLKSLKNVMIKSKL